MSSRLREIVLTISLHRLVLIKGPLLLRSLHVAIVIREVVPLYTVSVLHSSVVYVHTILALYVATTVLVHRRSGDRRTIDLQLVAADTSSRRSVDTGYADRFYPVACSSLHIGGSWSGIEVAIIV